MNTNIIIYTYLAEFFLQWKMFQIAAVDKKYTFYVP
jgi:hypothetical protein